jgi:uncharacterized protein YkwD
MRTKAPLALLSLVLACATTSTIGKPRQRPNLSIPSQFPTLTALRRIEAAAAPNSFERELKRLRVNTFELAGPLADRLEDRPHEPQGPFETMLAEAARGQATTPESLHCVAREVGRFWLQHRAMPADDFKAFVGARCGLVGTTYNLGLHYTDASPSLTDEAIVSAWKAGFLRGNAERLRQGNDMLGTWYGRNRQHAVAVIASMKRELTIEPVELVPVGDLVVLRGRANVRADYFGGRINKGPVGFAYCDPDPSVAPPAFALYCPIDHSDEKAWITVNAYLRERAMGPDVLTALVWPAGKPGNTFRQARWSGEAAVAQGSHAERILAALNEARARVGLLPLRVVAAESKTAQALAPHYFSALDTDTHEDVMDTIAMGMRAGWEVGEPVLYGHFLSGRADGQDPHHLVANLLESPSGREALLGEDVQRIAIGPFVYPGGHHTGVIVSTYTIFEGRPDDDFALVVAKRLGRQRRGQFLPPFKLYTQLQEPLREASRAVKELEVTPEGALDEALQGVVDRSGHSVYGWSFTVNRVQDVVFPRDLFANQALDLAIGASYRKLPQEPWGEFAVFVITLR